MVIVPIRFGSIKGIPVPSKISSIVLPDPQADGAAGQDGADGSDGADGNNHPSIFGGSAASVSVSENSTAVFYTASATDPDAGDTPTFTKGTAGGDEGLFTLTSDGKLSFTSAADYENPLSQAGGNTYSVQIIASDGRGGTDTQDVTVNVTDITENSTLELNETDGATFNILQGNTICLMPSTAKATPSPTR